DAPDAGLLEIEAPEMIWIEVPGRLAGDPAGRELMEALHHHGYTLVLRGRPAGELPAALLPACKPALIHADEHRRLAGSRDDAPAAGLLEIEAPEMIWIEVPGRLAGAPAGLELMEALHHHGYTLVLRGRPAGELPAALLPAFKLALIHVDEDRRLDESVDHARRAAARRSIPYAQAGGG